MERHVLKMNYVVLDLEWNQGVDKKKREKKKKVPNFEIIEIGAVRLNKNREKESEFSRLIKPQIYGKLHHVAKNLLHMKMEELQSGKPFVEVMADFLRWCGEDFIFCRRGCLINPMHVIAIDQKAREIVFDNKERCQCSHRAWRMMMEKTGIEAF